MYNLNSGYGQQIAHAMANAYAVAGKVAVVCPSTSLSADRLREMFVPDPEGKNRYFQTLGEAVASLLGTANALIVMAPGTYAESIVIPRSQGGLTILGLGNRGEISIAPTAAAVNGITFSNDNLTLVNIDVDVSGSAGSLFAVKGTGSRLRLLLGCKLEGASTLGSAALGVGPGSVAAVTAGTEGRSGDLDIESAEFCWSDHGVKLIATDFGVPTEVFITKSRFHNLVTSHVTGVPGAFGIGSVACLEHVDNVHDNAEGGVAPTKFFTTLNGAVNDDGIVTGNRFATATNAAAAFQVNTRLFWVVNATRAGWTTAQPA